MSTILTGLLVAAGVSLAAAPVQAAVAIDCSVDDASLTWGFKETFRSYISGTIANGEWIVADGATYAVPDFGWSGGTGDYDPSTAAGLVAFAGSIQFTGHGGALDTTVANPQVSFLDDDTAVLLLDVAGTTQEGVPITATGVEFAELDLTGGVVTIDDDVLTITAAPAVLAAEGAEAFGTYEAGEVLDPISAEFALDSACSELGATDETSSNADLSWLPWGIAGLVALAGVVVAIVMRRRAGA